MARKQLKRALLSTAVAAGLAAAAMPAHALSLGISGQINKQISHVDNGDESATAVMDNTNSGSRFRFTGEEDIGNGLKVGGVWEWQWQNTPSSGADFNAAGEIPERTASLSDRKTELYFAGKWGKVSLGKGDGAGNGAAEVDLSGTTVIDYCGANGDQLGSFNFQTSTGGNFSLPSGVRPLGNNISDVGDMLGCFDMFSRNNRIRYDTPKLAKWLTISVSRGQSNTIEGAVRASGSIGSTKIAAALASGTQKDETESEGQFTTAVIPIGGTLGDITATVTTTSNDVDVTAISGSVLLKNGLNFTLSYSMSSEDNPGTGKDFEQTFTYFKAGYKTGKHAVSLAFGQTDFDTGTKAIDDANPTSVALAYVYNIAKDVELYAAYRTTSADDINNTSLDDVSSLTVGSRIKWK